MPLFGKNNGKEGKKIQLGPGERVIPIIITDQQYLKLRTKYPKQDITLLIRDKAIEELLHGPDPLTQENEHIIKLKSRYQNALILKEALEEDFCRSVIEVNRIKRKIRESS